MNHLTSTNCLFPVSDLEEIKAKVLNWSKQFSTFCFLDNHQYHAAPHSVECLLAAGVRNNLSFPSLQAMQAHRDQVKNWLFGHLAYDLINNIEGSPSKHMDAIGFADINFFEPEYIIRFNNEEMVIIADDPREVHRQVMSTPATRKVARAAPLSIHHRIAKEEYLAIIQQLQQHILRGDCYEINFCQEFYATNATIDPLHVYHQLSSVSPNPFSALYRVNDQWLICASPERFLRKEGSRIISQPIKGTAKRIPGNPQEDEKRKEALGNSRKDRSENVMVVDLMRNDLAKVCKEGSVHVDELYGIYSFPQVHQMISTISGELRDDVTFTDIIKATFPMGSMTGAPKKRVMELIEQYEKTKRGIFSGALGYLSPEDDFDFNVVIRSIMFNAATGYLSFQAGSGITFYSDPLQEWEECMLKAGAMQSILT